MELLTFTAEGVPCKSGQRNPDFSKTCTNFDNIFSAPKSHKMVVTSRIHCPVVKNSGKFSAWENASQIIKV